MEQPRYREAAAGEGCDGPAWSRDPLWGGGGGSAAWNGSCARPGEEEEEDHELPFCSPAGPRCSCRCRGEPAAPPTLPTPQRDGSCSLTCRNRAPGPPPEEGEEDAGGEGRGGRRLRRRQRQRSAPKERSEGRRQRPARRRSRGEATESPGPAEGPAGYRQLLAAALARAARRLLSCCCRLGAAERSPARGWGRWARSGSLRAARWLRAGPACLLRSLWMLLALLLLALMLLLGCLRLLGRWGAAAARRLGAAAAWGPPPPLRRTLGGGGPGAWNLWEWTRGRLGGPGSAAAAGGEEVTRLVAMAEVPEEELNPFEVLGVELSASDAELRRAYRRLAVLVHPDKSQHPRAEAAFKVLQAAWDRVSSPEKRREYEIKQLAEQELRCSVGQFLSRLQEELSDALNTMACSRCQGRHRRVEVRREPGRGRYCGQCGALHPAEEGDLWAESRLLGLRVTYLARMEGRIYDVTEWAGCQRLGIAPDAHRVPYHISCAARGTAPAGRHRTPAQGSSPSAADLQDLFLRLLQGSSGAVPGGPFPPPPTPPGPFAPSGPPPGASSGPGAPPRPEGAAPKADAKHKRRKKLRRPLQR